jgi:hypothetical protein
MSDITSTISETPPLTSTIGGVTTVNVSTFSEGGRTLSELTDVDLQGVTDGSVLIYDTNEFVARTVSGDATLSASGVLTISPNAVTLGVDTSGAYVSTLTGTPDQITALGSGGETANVTLSLPQNISSGSSPTFNNITLNGVINNSDLTAKLDSKAPLHNPTFTGTVSGITKSMVGLGAVDNTSDIDKPLSTAAVAALDNKVDKVAGQGLSDNNYTLSEKNKLAGIAEGAEVNVNADWASTEGDSQILNKPFLGSASASSVTDFATALQGEKADTALQPLAFDYRGEYNNGDGTYTYNTVVLWNGLLYKKISNPNNPGYPPSGSDWELFEPEIGSPAFDQWIQTTLDNKVDRVQGQGLSDNNYTLAEKNKLAGVADGATANLSDSYLLNRENHTGSQSYTTITGLGTLATQSGTFSGSSSGTNTGDQTITLGGDASGSGTGSLNVTLASTGVVAGKYNNSGSSVTPFTVDVKGRITAVDTPVTLTPSWTNITNKPSTVAGYGISDAVDTSSTQVIGGSKSFTTSPTVPLLPTAAGHAASKAYVDTVSEGLHVHAAAHVIITTPLATVIGGGVTINYTNGTDGVNAKLTASAPVTWSTAFADPDITTGSRVIIAGQGTSAHNGIYVVSSATELTRASDFDTPTEMAGGDFVFVTHGTYADTGWVLSEPVTQVGVSPVIFTQFSGAGAYEAGSGLSRDGTTFSVVAGTGISVDGSVSLSTVGSPGTYRSVTVDTYGRVTSGSNPTTLSGYGITDAASSTALSGHISDASVHLTTTQNTLLDGITVTSDKINYLSDVSSNIQSQLDGKSATTHGHSNATTSVSGFLSSSDKTKLDGIAAGAEVNVNADWAATTGDAVILNKPTTLSGYGITDAVNLSGTQTITGTKTFNAPVTVTSNFVTIQSDALNPSYGLKITNTNSFDPGTPLLVDGRARVVHGMTFAAGITNFTNNSDHSHVLWTAQNRNSWQMIQNGGTSSSNRNTFVLTTVGSTASQTFFNESNAYSIDTTGVVSSSVSPFLATGIKINYNTAGSGLAIGDYVQITFNPGAAGVVANTYPGVVTAGPTTVTIDGSTRFQYTFSLEDFTSGVNWVSASARSELIYLNSNSVNNVRVSYAPTQIDGTRVSLAGNYSSIGRYVLVTINGHTAFEGESAVLAITGSTKIGLVAGSYNCFVKKVIDANNFVISIGNAKTGWASTSGTTGSSGWVLYKGSTDAVHQYTPALQHFFYQRFPTSDTSATTTGGNRAVALGNSAEVDGDFSYSLGHKSAVYGAHSVALGGEDSFVTGNYSTVLGGQGLTSSGTHQTIIGKYNTIDSSSTKPFIVGWGTSDTNRSNLLELSTTTLSVNTAISSTGSITGNTIVKSGGTSSQFLKADGSVDSNSYSLTSHGHSDATTSVSGFLSSTDKSKLDNIPAGVNYGVVTDAFPSGFGSGIANINWQAGTYWSGYLGLVGGTLIQFQNVVAGKIITLSITGSGSPVSWPTGITWLGGSAPTLANGQTRIIKILATSTSTFVASVDTKLNSSASYLDLVDVPTSFTPAVHSHDVVGTQSYTAGFMSYSDKVKLDGIASGAEVNVNADWNATTGDAAILNKPTTLSGYGITDATSKNFAIAMAVALG